MSGRQRAMTMALIAAVALAFADASVVALALPDLYGEFDTTIVGVSWVLTTYALAVALTAVPVALLHRRLRPLSLVVVGAVGFSLASLIAGMGQGNNEERVAGRSTPCHRRCQRPRRHSRMGRVGSRVRRRPSADRMARRPVTDPRSIARLGHRRLRSSTSGYPGRHVSSNIRVSALRSPHFVGLQHDRRPAPCDNRTP